MLSRSPASGSGSVLNRTGDVARFLGETEATIRWWSDLLLKPSRSKGGQRHFSKEDVEILKKVKRLTREEGVSLSRLRVLLRKEKDGTDRQRKESVVPEVWEGKPCVATRGGLPAVCSPGHLGWSVVG